MRAFVILTSIILLVLILIAFMGISSWIPYARARDELPAWKALLYFSIALAALLGDIMLLYFLFT